MSFILRPYQTEMVSRTREKLRTNKAVLLQAPTGAGKTAIGANMVDSAVKKNNTCFFIVHRQELIEQTMEAFTKQEIPFGVVAAGYYPSPYQPVQICSIGTLKNRIDKLPIRPKVILWDECHHVAAGGWAKVFHGYSEAQHIGLSATPERLDGQGLGEWFDAMVVGPSIRWLIDEGYLVDYKLFGSDITPDLSKVKSNMGDFAIGEVSSAMDKPTITGDAIEHYLRHARGKRFLSFGTSRVHSQHISDQFQTNGVMAIHVDGETDKNDRRMAMQGFRANNITGLSNVDLFGEGVDVPAVECLIDLGPSKSLGKVMQRWGRVLRPVYAPGFDLNTREGRLAAIAASVKPYAIILDHAANWKRHGFPDQDRIWSLDSKKRKKKPNDGVMARQCPNCHHLHPRAPACPVCGYIYPVNSREVDYIDGELQEISVNQRKARNRALLQKARTLPELITLAIMWEIPNPELWAENILEERKKYRTQKIRSYYGNRTGN